MPLILTPALLYSCAVLTCCTVLAVWPGAIGSALVLYCTYPVGKPLHSEQVVVRKSRGNLWRNWVSFLHRVADSPAFTLPLRSALVLFLFCGYGCFGGVLACALLSGDTALLCCHFARYTRETPGVSLNYVSAQKRR